MALATTEPEFRFALFISYSTDPDYALVRSLEGALETFHQLPTPNELTLQGLSVCVDGSDFHSKRATDVEGIIREHLAKSERMLVLCSARAGASPWVAKEIEWFIEARGAGHVWTALTEGADFDTAAKGFSPPLLKAGFDKRIAYDLRGYRRSGRRLTAVRDFDDEFTRLAADLYGRPAGELRPVWFREQQKRARERVRLLTMVSVALAVFLAAAVYFYVASEAQRQRAVEEAARARRQQYIASVNFARRALDDGSVPQARQFLEAQVPAADQEDLRDFDWFYLMGRATTLTSRLAGDETTFTTVSVSADGRLVAASGRTSRSSAGIGFAEVPQPVYVWSGAHATRRLLAGHRGEVHAVLFSPAGSTLVSSGDDGLIVWDAEAGRESKRIPLSHYGDGLAFSPDGRRLATTSGAEIIVFDTGTWTETGRLVAYPDQHVFAMAFSPDGAELAGGGLDQVVHVWNLATRRQVKLEGHKDKITSVAWSSKNALATGSRDGTVILWDGNGVRKPDVLNHPDGADALAFSPDGALLAVGLGDPLTFGARKAIQLWDVASRTPRGSLKGHSGRVDALAFGPDGHTLYSTGEDGVALAWNVAQAAAAFVVETGERSFWSVAFSLDGKRVAMGANGGRIRVRAADWSGVALTLPEQDKDSQDVLRSRVAQLAFDSAGRLVTVNGRATVRRCDVSGSPTCSVAFQSDRFLTGAQVAPDGQHIAVTDCDHQVLIGPWPAAAPMTALHAEGCPTLMEWGPDSQHFVSASGSPVNAGSATVYFWEVGVRMPIRKLEGLGTWPTAAGFSRDGSRIAAGDWDGRLVIWDVATGRAEHAIDAHADYISGLAFSPSGRVIATASHDKTVRLWDSVTGQERATFQEGDMTFRALAFSPSGQSLIAVGSEGDDGDEGRAVTWSIPIVQPTADRAR